MQIQISVDEVFTEYKTQIADLHHDLLLEKLKCRKMAELIEQYENTEHVRSRSVAAGREPAAEAFPAPPGTEERLPRRSMAAPSPPPGPGVPLYAGGAPV